MTQASKSSVEPLSDAAWSRVEAGVFARLERGEHLAPPTYGESDDGAPASAPVRAARRALRVWGLAAGIAAAAAAAALWLHAGAWPESERSAVPLASDARSGEVAATPPAPREVAPPVASDAVRVADGALVTTTDAPRRLQLGDSELTLAESSVLAVDGDDARGFRLTLERGRVDCQVAPRAGRPAFVVEAGDARVTVIGTRFSVSREPSGTHVDVLHGTVRVTTPETSVLLTAGQSWPAKPLDAERPADAPVPARATTSPRPTKAPSADPAARFERATRLESSNPDAALRLYRALSQKPGPWAATALYAAARLEIEHRHARQGRALLEQYLARYPQGANAADARALLARP